MTLRDERKLQTRQALLDAAMELTSSGRSIATVSLREIAREAGVVPTAFYRHFRSVDELGLALVDEVGHRLRQIMREARRFTASGDIAIRTSVKGFVHYVRSNRRTFTFIVRERLGGPEVVREAISREIQYFVGELAGDLRVFPKLAQLPTTELEMIAHLVVHTVFHLAADILDLPEEPTAREEELILRTIKQLRLIFLGGAQWKPSKAEV